MSYHPREDADMSSRIAAWRSTYASCLGDAAPSSRTYCGPGSAQYGLFVNNLPLNVSREQLCQLFEPYSRVRELLIVQRPEFTTHCFGYVLLDSDDDTKRAIQQLNGTLFGGLRLKVEATFGKASHIFGVGESCRGSPVGQDYRRSSRRESWEPDRRFRYVDRSTSHGNSYSRFGYNGGYRPPPQYPAGRHVNSRNASPSCNTPYNSHGTDDSYSTCLSIDAAREITCKLRDSWERHILSVPEDEMWPSFDELLERVSVVPHRVPFLRYPREYTISNDDLGDQPTFWPISDDDEEACEEAEHYHTILDVLRRRHGDEEVEDFLEEVMPEIDADQKAQQELRTYDKEDEGADDTIRGGRFALQVGFTRENLYVQTQHEEDFKASNNAEGSASVVRSLGDQFHGSVLEDGDLAGRCEGRRGIVTKARFQQADQQEILLAKQKRILEEVEERISRLLRAEAGKPAVKDSAVPEGLFLDMNRQESNQKESPDDDWVLEKELRCHADEESQDMESFEAYENVNTFENGCSVENANAVSDEAEQGEQFSPGLKEEVQSSSQRCVKTDSVRECYGAKKECCVYEGAADDTVGYKPVSAVPTRHVNQSFSNHQRKIICDAADDQLNLPRHAEADVPSLKPSDEQNLEEDENAQKHAHAAQALDTNNVDHSVSASQTISAQKSTQVRKLEETKSTTWKSAGSNDDNTLSILAQYILEMITDLVLNPIHFSPGETPSVPSAEEQDKKKAFDGDEQSNKKNNAGLPSMGELTENVNSP